MKPGSTGMAARWRPAVADPRPEPAPFNRLALETAEPTAFGSGFLSGVASAVLGIAGFGIVLALRFPQAFGYAELRPLRSLAYLQAAIHVTLVTSFLLGTVSAWLRTNKTLALTGIGFTLAAALLGGSRAAGSGDAAGAWLGVDFFVLNLVLYSAVFVPLERLFALRPEQPVFRRQWPVDLTYFFINSLLIEVLTILTLKPAVIFFDWARVELVRGAVTLLPLPAQVLALLLVADFTQYWVHRAFHRSRWLWRFHAIHHSIEQMDWLAGSRLHLVDVIATRGLTYVPIFVLGFSEPALMVYVFLVAIQATFIHANVRWTFRGWQRIVATPAFHHWHHSAEPQSIDKNFAVHTPAWDLLFGTFYLPARWPSAYGLAHGRQVPPRWASQLVYPLRRSRGQ
jgi:sterol desaturase/sphingolipid hydroxylase (fatty acid hydroxylase superfamily)